MIRDLSDGGGCQANSSAPHCLVTEKTWPQQTLAQFWAGPGQRDAGSPCRGSAEGARGRQASSSAGRRSRRPSSPSCLSAATSSSLSPLYFPLGHVHKVSLHSQAHTQLKESGKCMCDTLRLSHRDRSGGKCATLDELIRCMGMPDTSPVRGREHCFP